jgi:phosphoglycerate dehydrogenase-like enzyme
VNASPRIAILSEDDTPAPASVAALTDAVADGGGMLSAIEDAEGLIWNDWRDPEVLRDTVAGLPNLRWVQFVTAGIDLLMPAIDESRLWTSAKGCYSRPIAEYVVAGLLAGFRSFPAYARARQWRAQPTRSLYGSRVTIIGGGGIASAIVDLLAPFDCYITVVRRSSVPMAGAARTVSSEVLLDVLPDTDVVVVAAALTASTSGIVDADALSRLPAGAWLVNVGRGPQVVTDALVAALADGRLGGAVLDVTDPEPLPEGHPLWACDNLILTPHVSCPPSLSVPYLLDRIRENVARFGRGEPLMGLVDAASGY